MVDSGQAHFDVFSTCPPSSAYGHDYSTRVAEVARWSERAGCRGILIYTDHSLLDPWLVAQLIIERTQSIRPLVAVQPLQMHPYTAAKMVASLGALYGRGVLLNMVSGGFRNDLSALDDRTEHDRRYDRLLEYVTIVKGLLAGGSPVTLRGDFYRVENLRLTPAPSPELMPDVFVSGSSEAGAETARAIGAVAIRYPRPATAETPTEDWPERTGIRTGIIARESDEDAWEVALRRFPADRRGQLTHQLAMKVSDSVWHRQLSEMAGAEKTDGPYWLFPFENYKTMCPYLVGSYQRVGEELARYHRLGVRTLILDVPPDEEELWHTRRALEPCLEEVAS
ncbi:MAG TPA: LLM class flavin-dependent oxidoreductase [Thermoanaerobaculia bacterium]|nr:LLM class flavin-dependent oxidoreductase [Thermoanaerobaculia bacterium]